MAVLKREHHLMEDSYRREALFFFAVEHLNPKYCLGPFLASNPRDLSMPEIC